jgi:WD40 repeat protein
MKKSPRVGQLLLLTALAASVASAQSPRADISWLAGGHLSPVASVSYSPDGAMLASSGYFGDTLKLWRASDGTMVRTFGNTNATAFIFGPMEPVTFLPDGRTVIGIGEGSAIGVWNVADGKLLRTISVSGSDLALSPDGTLIAVAASGLIKLVRFSDGVIVRSITWPADLVQAVAFSPDGAVVAGGDRTGMLRTFRVSDGGPLLSFQAHSDDITALRYSIDGSRIASSSADHTVKLWGSSSGQLIGTLSGHTDAVNAIALSRDGALLASGSQDNTIKLWSMPAGTLVGTLNQPSPVSSLGFNASSSKLAVAIRDELREWDVPSQTLVRNLARASNQISGVVFTPDNSKVVSGSYDGKVSVHDVETGSLLRQIIPGGNIFAVAASADVVAAAINVPNVIKLYRVSDGTLLRTLQPAGTQPYTYATAFSPDGATLATGHFQSLVRLWNVADGSLLQTFGPGGASGSVNGLAYNSDGSLLATAWSDGFVRIWDSQGNLVRSMGPAGQALSSCVVSPDNQFVLTGGQNGLLQLWRISTGDSVYSFTGTGGISDVRFVPSGYAFYAGRTEGSLQSASTLRVYRTSDHAVLETYTLETGGFGSNPVGPLALDVSPDGRHLAYGRDDATLVKAYSTLIAAPTSAVAFTGQIIQGSFQDLLLADSVALVARPATAERQSAPVQLDISGHSPLPNPTRLSFQVVASANVGGFRQEVWMLNAQSGALELVDSRSAATTDQTVRIDLGSNFARFIDAAGNLKARVKWSLAPSGRSRAYQVSVDQGVWAAGL